MKKKAL